LEQIEHLLTAEEAVGAEGGISCSSSHRSHVTTNTGQSPSLTTRSRNEMILTKTNLPF
jgi:hypothetical protein